MPRFASHFGPQNEQGGFRFRSLVGEKERRPRGRCDQKATIEKIAAGQITKAVLPLLNFHAFR